MVNDSSRSKMAMEMEKKILKKKTPMVFLAMLGVVMVTCLLSAGIPTVFAQESLSAPSSISPSIPSVSSLSETIPDSSNPPDIVSSSVSPVSLSSTSPSPPPPPSSASHEPIAKPPNQPLTPIPDVSKPENKHTLIQAADQRVKLVASSAEALYGKACGFMSKCRAGSGSCTRLACGYGNRGDKDFKEPVCVTGLNVSKSGCTNSSQDDGKGVCTSILLNLDKPFIRYPTVVKTNHTPDAHVPMYQHTCVQSSLTDSFKASIKTQNDFLATGWIYFASVAGTFFTFPGQNVFDGFETRGFPFDCEPFDPRFRPWFKQASSPPKKLSIVVDRTNEMCHPVKNMTGQENRMSLLKRTLVALNGTLVHGTDTVFLTTEAAGNNSVAGAYSSGPLSQEKVADMQPDMGAPDLLSGIQTGLSAFGEPSKDHLEILLVFTRAKQFNAEPIAAAVNAYNSKSLTATGKPLAVFLYGSNIESNESFANLTNLSDLVNGTARNIGTGDPLLALYSYFNYLASFLKGQPPTWSKLYQDKLSLGNVTTRMQPVFDSEGRFVGVAGLDVRSPVFAADLAGNISDAAPPTIVHSTRDTLKLPNCTLPCPDGYPGLNCAGEKDLETADVVCDKVVENAEKEKCCKLNECTASAGCPSIPIATMDLWVQVSMAAVVVALLSMSGR